MNKKPEKAKETQQKSKQSPTKNNKKEKIATQTNILETMKNDIDFLMQFTAAQINFMVETYDIIIFQRGMVLAKQKQIIDYVGVIINGGAIAQKSKAKYKPNSFIGHGISLFGMESHRHPQTITAQSDGILFAVRIEALIIASKQQVQQSVKSKIINFISKETLSHLKGERHFGTVMRTEFQILDEKMAQKYIQSCKLLSQIYESISDPKERQKFQEEFPIYSAKEKTLIASRHSRPYVILVLKGDVMVKYGLGLKKQTKIIESNQLYNAEGFIFDHIEFSNLYAGSAEVAFLIIDKQKLINSFKLNTFVGISKYCIEYLQRINNYSWGNLVIKSQDESGAADKKEIWSPFRKSFSIQEIPSKKQVTKSSKQPVTNKKKQSINVFQTLYQTYSNVSKNKLHSKQTHLTQYKEVTEKVHASTVQKTQYGVEEKGTSFSSNEKLKRLQGQILALKEQNLALQQTIKKYKMDVTESQSKLKMIQVFRQINNLKGLKEKQEEGQQGLGKTQGKSVTLKQAFELHLKNKKLQLLVAKCAFKWLSITRQNRNRRQNQSMASLISNTLQKSALANIGS